MPLNEFRHRLTPGLDQVLGTACEVGKRYLADVNAEIVIKCGEHFTELDRPLVSFSAQAIGCTDDLSMFHAAAGQHSARNSRPMISPGILVDRRCAAE